MPRPRKAPKIEPGKVYIKPRGHDQGFDIFWLEGTTVRRVHRSDEHLAKEWAARKQRDLDNGDVGEAEMPFADTVQDHDGTAGNSWLELLWQAALMVGLNPRNEGLQKAAGTVAKLATAARKFVSAGDLGEDEMSDAEFLTFIAGRIGPMLDKLNLTSQQKLVLKVLQGGKSEAAEVQG